MSAAMQPSYRRTSNLVDVLDRVLDKGLVVAGDIRVSLAEVELLSMALPAQLARFRASREEETVEGRVDERE